MANHYWSGLKKCSRIELLRHAQKRYFLAKLMGARWGATTNMIRRAYKDQNIPLTDLRQRWLRGEYIDITQI